MANSCEFNMKATGKKKDIERLYNMLNYDESEKYYFSRIFDCFYPYEDSFLNAKDNEKTSAFIYGCCAHSLKSSMLRDDCGDDGCLISIDRASKLLSLKIEVVSEEPGLNFTEYYVIDNGKILVSECNDLITDEEFEKYKDDEEGLNDLYYARSEEIINKLY